jgi:hypothetical protein
MLVLEIGSFFLHGLIPVPFKLYETRLVSWIRLGGLGWVDKAGWIRLGGLGWLDKVGWILGWLDKVGWIRLAG